MLSIQARSFLNTWLGMALAAFAAMPALAGPEPAAAAFPALERPALQVKSPERQVLLAAALAGKRLVAVGERGIVVLSDDGGKTWRQARQVPVSVTLTAVSFAGERAGWAVGHGGVVLHTQDAGETWHKQADGVVLAQAALAAAEAALRASPDSPTAQAAAREAHALVADGPDKPLLDVAFRDASHGWIVGAYNLFFETSDGGAHWASAGSRLENPKALHLYAIRTRGDAVYIAGEQGQLHRSLDGGRSFAALASPYRGSWFTLTLDADGALLAGGLRGTLFRSTDQGASWTAVAGAPAASISASTMMPDGRAVFATQAGQLLASRAGAPLTVLPAAPMPPLAGLLALPDRSVLALGLGGVRRLPQGDDK